MSITNVAPTQIDSFYTSTIQNYKTKTKENWVHSRPIIEHLMANASERDEGGYFCTYPLTYGFNTTTTFFDGMDRGDTTPQETALPASYKWANIYSFAAIAETDVLANSGRAQIFDLFKSRITQCEKSIFDVANSEAFGDGTNYGGKTFIGLAAGISSTPTSDPASGAVGGIPVSTNTWWQNIAVTSAGSWAANGTNGSSTDLVFQTYLSCTDTPGKYPTAFVCDQTVYQFYNNSLMKQERIVTNEKPGTLNFPSLVYGPHNTPVLWDRMCPSGTLYMINNEDLKIVIDPRWYMEWGPPKSWPDQEAFVRAVKMRFHFAWLQRMFMAVTTGWTA